MARAKPIIRPCPRCGRNYEYRRASGRYFELCEHCRQPDCVICGQKVPIERGHKNTCSIACEVDKSRAIQLVFSSKRIAEDPDFYKRRHEKNRQARERDPAKMAAYLQKERERHAKRSRDSAYVAQRKEYHARHYQKNREQILQQRREFYAALPLEEKEKRYIIARVRSREWRRAKIEEIRQDPEAWQAYQEAQREIRRKIAREKALAELMKQTQELLNVADRDESK